MSSLGNPLESQDMANNHLCHLFSTPGCMMSQLHPSPTCLFSKLTHPNLLDLSLFRSSPMPLITISLFLTVPITFQKGWWQPQRWQSLSPGNAYVYCWCWPPRNMDEISETHTSTGRELAIMRSYLHSPAPPCHNCSRYWRLNNIFHVVLLGGCWKDTLSNYWRD